MLLSSVTAVRVGGAACSSAAGRTTVTVQQTAQQAILNWQSFNIGAGETTIFNQPSATSIVWNRINNGASPSQIYGNLEANGVVVLSSGRPGVQLRFCAEGRGTAWSEPLELLPYANEKEEVSCGYTSLLATGPDRFLIIYSDFKYPTPAGALRKAIKVCEVTVTPDSARRLQAPKWRE